MTAIMKPEKTHTPSMGWFYFWIAAVFVILVALVIAPFMVAGLSAACKCCKTQLSNMGIAMDKQHG